jgi:hypothetical protein
MEDKAFKVVIVMLLLLLLLFDIFILRSVHPLIFLDKWFVQIYLNVSYGKLNVG